MQTKALRAANTVTANRPELISLAVSEMLGALLEANDLSEKDLLSIHFTLTADLTSLNPATAARQKLHFNEVAMICSQEALIEDTLPLCVRALVLAQMPMAVPVRHVYLGQAASLREDWVGIQQNEGRD